MLKEDCASTLKVHLAQSLPLPSDVNRPRIDLIVFVVNLHSKYSLQNVEKSLHHVDATFFLGKVGFLATGGGKLPSRHGAAPGTHAADLRWSRAGHLGPEPAVADAQLREPLPGGPVRPWGCPAHGLIPGRRDHSLLLKTKSGLDRPWVSGHLPAGPKLLCAPAGSAWDGGAQLVGPAHSHRALCLYPSDAFHLHLRLHLNKGPVAKNSWKIIGLMHHFDFADELTQSN
ncbi:centromere protein M isoform 2-T2 [Hipposideros larvatus]